MADKDNLLDLIIEELHRMEDRITRSIDGQKAEVAELAAKVDRLESERDQLQGSVRTLKYIGGLVAVVVTIGQGIQVYLALLGRG